MLRAVVLHHTFHGRNARGSSPVKQPSRAPAEQTERILCTVNARERRRATALPLPAREVLPSLPAREILPSVLSPENYVAISKPEDKPSVRERAKLSGTLTRISRRRGCKEWA